ncbi:MAG: cysteine--tRNA ligase [Bacteroidota bacterium]
MQQSLQVYNTLTRQKEAFAPLTPPRVGMYVCGPTVYGPAHLGHARSAVNFDVVVRYLRHLGYQVRYVRNITDVGHLERDADDGADKIVRQAQREALEPMEVVQRYTNSYRHDMAMLNTLPPSIEPQASGHLTEQIAMIQKIMAAGLAYESQGSVYFDVKAYHKHHPYGQLSGRVLDDLIAGTRELVGQQAKRDPLDFALWKKATPIHIMRWPSPWGEGFPGWHIECSAIATKYLGSHFDIHAGGVDLLFPHHECELAQSQAAQQTSLARYWLHNNLVTIDGQKMSKSLGNFITLAEFFGGTHALLDQAYSPMVLRCFILQAHYRSPLSFSTQALQAAQVGYLKLMNGLKALEELPATEAPAKVNKPLGVQIEAHCTHCYAAMNDDFNTAKVMSALFQLLRHINTFKNKPDTLATCPPKALEQLATTYRMFVQDILGLIEESSASTTALIEILLNLYRQAKADKQYAQVVAIRAQLKTQGIVVQDSIGGISWSYG